MKAVDPALTNGVIVFRMAHSAEPVGTHEQVGNGRINMARALEDTGTDFIQPSGAAPVGNGGPYVAAAAPTITVGAVTPNTSFSPTAGFIMGTSGNSFTIPVTLTNN